MFKIVIVIAMIISSISTWGTWDRERRAPQNVAVSYFNVD